MHDGPSHQVTEGMLQQSLQRHARFLLRGSIAEPHDEITSPIVGTHFLYPPRKSSAVMADHSAVLGVSSARPAFGNPSSPLLGRSSEAAISRRPEIRAASRKAELHR